MADGAGLVFRTGDGQRLATVPPPAPVIEDAQADLRAWAAQQGLEIGPDSALPWWDGAAPDYDWIVSSLLSQQAM